MNLDSHKMILLKILNKILTLSGNNEIQNIPEFVMIDGENIMKKEILDFINEISDKIFEHYTKTELKWSDRGKKRYILSMIRKMAKKCGYKMEYKISHKTIKYVVKAHMHYTIKEI